MAKGPHFSATLEKQGGGGGYLHQNSAGLTPQGPSPPTCTSQSFLSFPLGPQGHGKARC